MSDGVTSVHVSYLWFPGRCHIWPRAAGLISIMASEVTQIVAPFCPPQRLFKSDSNNGPSPSHLNLVSDRAISVHVSYLWFPGRCHIWPRAAGLTSIMASEVTRIVAPFPPRVYSSLTRIMAPLQAISILHQMELHLFMSPTYVFWQVPYLVKGCRPDFKNSLRGDSNSGPILAPLSLFESDSNNGPSPGHSNMELQTLISPKAILSQL